MSGGTRLGCFKELLDLVSEEARPILSRVRELVHEVDPATCEVVWLGERSAVYGVGRSKARDGYAYLLAHPSHVDLGFFRGSTLPDPARLLEGTGLRIRHARLRALDDVARPGIRALL